MHGKASEAEPAAGRTQAFKNICLSTKSFCYRPLLKSIRSGVIKELEKWLPLAGIFKNGSNRKQKQFSRLEKHSSMQ